MERDQKSRETRWRDGAAARVILPSLLLLALGMVALFVISRDVALDLDRQALAREERVVSTLVKTKTSHWGKTAGDYAYWTDGYNHMSGEPDETWMADNFNDSGAAAQAADAMLLLRADLSAEVWRGSPRDDAALAAASGLSELAAAALAKGGPFAEKSDGLIAWRGGIAMAGVGVLSPQDKTLPDGEPRKFVVFIQSLSPAKVASWSDSLQIKGLRLVPPETGSPSSVALTTRRGTPLGRIEWESNAPGSSFLASHLVVRVAITAALVAALIALVLAWAATMRRLSESAAKAHALAESSRSKSAFLANMSHELRTPLNAIIGFSEMTKDEVFGPLGRPQYKEYACHVHASGKHLLQMINSLLDVAKFQAGQYEQKPAPVSLDELAAAALAAHRTRFEQAGLTLVRSGDGAALVMADQRSIARIFDVLLDNAAKFTPRGGKIDIELAGEPSPKIVVRDTGCGIPSEKLEAMGRPFEQAADVLRREHGGVGLGLAFAKMLMAGQGGSLSLESCPGQGTQVTLALQPAAAAVAQAA